MIKNVFIKNFKSIKEIRLELTSLNTILGGNNSGKSSLLQAIQFLDSIVKYLNHLQNWSWANEKIEYTVNRPFLKYTPHYNFSSLFGESNKICTISMTDQNDNEIILKIKKQNESNLKIKIEGQQLGNIIKDNIFSIFVPGLSGIPVQEEFLQKDDTDFERKVFSGDSNKYFRYVLDKIYQHPDQNKKRKLNEVLKKLYGFSLERIKKTKNIDFKTTNAACLPVDCEGTGFLRLVQVLSYLFLYEPQIALLEEPDNHLHPNKQKEFAYLIKELIENYNFQFLISTHSHYLLNELDGSVFVAQSGEVSKQEKQNIHELFVNMGSFGFLNTKYKALIFTEDEDDKLLKILLKSNGCDMENTQFFSYKGCGNLNKLTSILESLKKINSTPLPILVHRDNDFLSEDELDKMKQECEKKYYQGYVHFLTIEGNDIESCFLDEDHLASCNPDIDKELIQRSIDFIVNDKKDMFIEIALNFINKSSQYRESIGAKAVEVFKIYETNPFRYIHGKKFLSLLKEKIKQETNKNFQFSITSPFLKNEPIVKVLKSAKVWKPEKKAPS